MNVRDILIFVNCTESHACSVAHVLSELGHRPTIINTTKVPNGEHLSVDYRSDRPLLKAGAFCGTIDQVWSSWNRRFSRMYSLPGNLHPADRTHVRNSTHGVVNGILQLLDDRFPVNPIGAARITSNKLAQLEAARRVGFRIPRTLVSNRFDDISAFVSSTGDACVKAYYAQGWMTDEGAFQAVTTRIRSADLGDPAAHEVAPHFYQEYIRKKCEYRLTIFGQYAAVVRINSSELEGNAATDWRATPAYLDTLTVHALPESVIKAARQLLDLLGLRFGTLDIAETYDGDLVFFEVNEAGQWLWQELHCPDCRLLQPFCEYLIAADDGFRWDAKQFRPEFDAAAICKLLDDDPRFQVEEEYPDQVIHVADERTASTQETPC